jgi:hypothetical protein
MKIFLKKKSIPIRQNPYILNPIYKEKVKTKIKKYAISWCYRTCRRVRMAQPYDGARTEARRDHDLCTFEKIE